MMIESYGNNCMMPQIHTDGLAYNWDLMLVMKQINQLIFMSQWMPHSGTLESNWKESLIALECDI